MEYTYDILSLLFLGGNFLIALLAYIDRNNKRK
ncbi:putative holin-like toxin [Petralouisia muris]|nr:putative holin-like toxin [Petralouisia muris]